MKRILRKLWPPGPLVCTLALAVTIGLLVGGGGYLLDDHGLSGWLRERSERALARKSVHTPEPISLSEAVGRLEQAADAKIDVDWAGFATTKTPESRVTLNGWTTVRGDLAGAFGLFKWDIDYAITDPQTLITIGHWGRIRVTATPAPNVERSYDLSPWLGNWPWPISDAALSRLTDVKLAEWTNRRDIAERVRRDLAESFRVTPTLTARSFRFDPGGVLWVNTTPEIHRILEQTRFEMHFPDTENWLQNIWAD